MYSTVQCTLCTDSFQESAVCKSTVTMNQRRAQTRGIGKSNQFFLPPT